MSGARALSWRRFVKSESGSLLLEASMIMPLMLLLTVVLLAIGFIAYQRSEAVHHTFQWTERAAYVWKDSHKDPQTGAFSYNEMDDVYSAMLSEGLGWLGAAFRGFKQAEIRLPDLALSGQSLSGAKLLRSSHDIVPDFAGTGSYYNLLLEGEVRAQWSLGAGDGSPSSIFQAGNADFQASSYYADPVELLRNVDLITTYAAKLKERFAGPEEAVEQMKELLPKPPDKPKIESAAQAAAYLRFLMTGDKDRKKTPVGDRVVDVLDSDGIAHDAKYYVNSPGYKEQIQKDVELIRSGQVKGVVWHFFYIEKEGKYGASKAMLKALEENGIMVVYHR